MLSLGTVPFLVGKPLIHGLDQDPDIRLVEDSPANLGVSLKEGSLDAALASSVFALGESPLPFWTDGPLVACDGPARSVLVLVRPGLPSPSGIRTLLLDPSSRTGREMALLILEESYGARPLTQETTPGADPFSLGADAVQIIGDAALSARTRVEEGWTLLDLGEEWKKLTQLPFVFAGWVGRPGFDPASVGDLLETSLERGLAARNQLVLDASPDLGLDEDALRRYLFDDMKYHLPAGQAAEALRTFDRLRRVPVT